ncbi:MAG: AhpC/TSA family protein [Prevotellaceae bacterium]|jgi:peroxiredoxin|nr:AhpC/TSA family protein [Prevotellaceae bacterium]
MSRILVSLACLTLISACASLCGPAVPLPETGEKKEKALRNIEITIKDEENKTVVLGKYTGTGISPADTAVTDMDGKAIFAGNKPLAAGVYAVMTKNRSLFDFLIPDTVNQNFSVSVKKDRKGNYNENLSFEGSAENEALYVRSPVEIPDSIIQTVDSILSKTGNDTATLNFLTRYILDKYLDRLNDRPKVMGVENVIIHIIDKYYLTGKAKMNDEKLLGELAEYANKNRETLTGKQAADLKMETVGGGAESLYDIEAPYILVCFFDASCFHCRHEIPEVYKIFRRFKNKGLAGFCVYARDDKKEWMDFLAKHKLTDWINAWDPANLNNYRIAYSVYSVPQIYVLDRDRKIVGRGLDSASLEQLLNHLVNNNRYNQ